VAAVTNQCPLFPTLIVFVWRGGVQWCNFVGKRLFRSTLKSLLAPKSFQLHQSSNGIRLGSIHESLDGFDGLQSKSGHEPHRLGVHIVGAVSIERQPFCKASIFQTALDSKQTNTSSQQEITVRLFFYSSLPGIWTRCRIT
jgi:hypothetical protein